MNGQRLLIIDADRSLRESLAHAMGRAGHQVATAGDVDEAFQQFLIARPAAVLFVLESLDDGAGDESLRLCRRFRALPGSEQLVIVALSSAAHEGRVTEAAFEAGATDCLARPVNYLLLERRLSQLLRARETSRSLQRSQRQLQAAQRVASLGDWHVQCASGRFTCSEEFSRILKATPEQAATIESVQDFLAWLHPEDASLAADAFASAMETGTSFSFECRLVSGDGKLRTVQLGGQREAQELSDESALSGSMRDITDQRSQQAQLRYLANYDALTRLPNESQLDYCLRRHTARGQSGVALVRLGLDDYQRMAESLTRPQRDELLRLLGARLNAAIRQRHCGQGAGAGMRRARHQDLGARVGRAEFAALLTDVDELKPALEVAERLRAELERPYAIEDQRIYLSVSGGLALMPLHAGDTEALARAAEAALGEAVRTGGGRTLVHDPQLEQRIRERRVREAALRSALDDGRFEVYYQPRVSSAQGRVIGSEALVRMRAEDGSLVPPSEFIPLAEELGLVVELGRFVVTEAIRQLRCWQGMGLVDRRFVMSVNISPRQFQDPHLFEHIEETLRNEHVAPSCLELEITENTLLADLALASRLLAARREIGVRVAIDDYGTGYSSLSYLRELPADTLKIDRCFIAGLGTNQTDEIIVRFTVQLAQALGLRVCAEGVETREQLGVLRSLKCEEVQGYLYGKPMAATDFTAGLMPAQAQGDALRAARPDALDEYSADDEVVLLEETQGDRAAFERTLSRPAAG